MEGKLFLSLQAAIDDAQKHYRQKLGGSIKFPDGSYGSPADLTQGKVAAWSFQVVDSLGKPLVSFVVSESGKSFIWRQV
jgi:hypothetical protein